MSVFRSVSRLVVAVVAGFGLISSAASAMELVAFEAPNCGACKLFKRDVLPIYADSAAGKVFPLFVFEMGNKVPFRLSQPITFTPTFVWIDNGVEVGRFAGYRGKDQFFAIVNKAASSQGQSGMRKTGM